jgi:type III restriction enzyme
VRWKFVLAKVLAQQICQPSRAGGYKHYRQTLFVPQAAVETSVEFAFGFEPLGYAPHWTYLGSPHQFEKHYYSTIGELRNKGEEYECAKALDLTADVKLGVQYTALCGRRSEGSALFL